MTVFPGGAITFALWIDQRCARTKVSIDKLAAEIRPGSIETISRLHRNSIGRDGADGKFL